MKTLQASDEVLADIRNKLGPMANLLHLIEMNVDRKLILSQLPAYRKSLEYLSGKKFPKRK